MLPSARPARRAVRGAIGTGALAGAMFFGAAATAAAQPPPPVPPPCTAAELARVMSGVSFDVSNYLSTHARERVLHQPQRPTQGSDPGSSPEVSRRQSASWGRASGHPATQNRLPEPLRGSDPLTVSAALHCSNNRGRTLPDVPDPWRDGLKARRENVK